MVEDRSAMSGEENSHTKSLLCRQGQCSRRSSEQGSSEERERSEQHDDITKRERRQCPALSFVFRYQCEVGRQSLGSLKSRER